MSTVASTHPAFTQENWMEPFIRFNTEKRKKVKSNFEKDFFKLMNNSVFGNSGAGEG